MDETQPTALAPRDLLVLSVLSMGPLHGYGIVRAVEERSKSGLPLDPANLHRVLRRMRRDGWIEETEEADGEGRRRIHALTAAGLAVLRAEVERLDSLLREVRPALKANPRPAR
jgi:PadR family transcriptional regulator, regulatory protein PadR